MRPLAPLATALLCGCYPGEVTTPDGRFKLRTAVHIVVPSSAPHTVFLLSDSQFTCATDAAEEEGAISNDLIAQLGAMLREGAQNMLIRASRLDDGAWAGEYPVRPYDTTQWSGRWSEAFYMRVDESAVSALPDNPYYYATSAYTQLRPDRDGEVTVGTAPLEESDVEVSFQFRDVGLSGHFTSTPCDLEDSNAALIIDRIETYLTESDADADQTF